MVRRARRNVVQWSGNAKDPALGLGQARPFDAPTKRTRKRAAPKAKVTAPKRGASTPTSFKITPTNSGWNVRCACGWSQVHPSKSAAHDALAHHRHLQPKPKQTTPNNSRSVPSARSSSPSRSQPKQTSQGVKPTTGRSQRAAETMKVRREGSRWMWWCIRCRAHQRGLDSDRAAHQAASKHRC